MAQPVVSVVLARKSSDDDVAGALESLRAQTFSGYEVIVSDPCESAAAAWNQGIRQSQGEFVAFLDSDHRWAPRKLEMQMAKLSANPILNWCYCGAQFHSGNILRPLLLNNFIPTSSVVARRSIFDEIGGFDESGGYRLSEDWDMWLRIAACHAAGLVAESLVQLPCINPPVEQFCASRKRVVEAAVARHGHSLKDLRSQSLAQICVSAGNAYLAANKRNEARDKFAEALTHTPLCPDAYLSWISSFLPVEAQQQIHDLHNLARHTQRAEEHVEQHLTRR